MDRAGEGPSSRPARPDRAGTAHARADSPLLGRTADGRSAFDRSPRATAPPGAASLRSEKTPAPRFATGPAPQFGLSCSPSSYRVDTPRKDSPESGTASHSGWLDRG